MHGVSLTEGAVGLLGEPLEGFGLVGAVVFGLHGLRISGGF
jgi:hypothetical protein